MNERIYTVSELNSYIKTVLDGDRTLDGIYIRGELSNYKIYPSGHHYFTMKDEGGALKCVMFKNCAARLRFRPESGMKVIAFGKITVYPRDGVYQLYATSITPDGVGELQIAYEQLKEKLYRAGLFDERHKKPIPPYPMRIGVVTSSAGAAVHDIIRVLRKRWRIGKILLLPVRVQGEEAPPEIAAAIRYANRHNVADVLIVGRGGGSMEDLWAFNDERVVRAIYDSDIPVISAVGHEPDVTLSDFAADLRAATPSNAAELCAPDLTELRGWLDSCAERSSQAMTRRVGFLRQRYDALSSARVLGDPRNYLNDRRQQLDGLGSRMAAAVSHSVSMLRERRASLAGRLDALSPLKVLGRGYAIARRADGAVVRSASDVKSGDDITLRLRKDEIQCTVR